MVARPKLKFRYFNSLFSIMTMWDVISVSSSSFGDEVSSSIRKQLCHSLWIISQNFLLDLKIQSKSRFYFKFGRYNLCTFAPVHQVRSSPTGDQHTCEYCRINIHERVDSNKLISSGKKILAFFAMRLQISFQPPLPSVWRESQRAFKLVLLYVNLGIELSFIKAILSGFTNCNHEASRL